MKKFAFISFLFCYGYSQAQNVGIGTLTPQEKLHVFNNGVATVLTETNSVNQYAAFDAKTTGGINDKLLLRKYMPGSSGSIAGVNLDNLSLVVSGAQAGALMVGVITANPLYLTTSNTERLRITPTGHFLFNNATDDAYFSVNTAGNAAGANFYNLDVTGQRYAVGGSINTTTTASAGVWGVTYMGGGVSPVEAQTYAVVGQSGDAGISIAGYSIGSTALRGKSVSGNALFTSGAVRLEGIGEANSRVLTSDASGNATWQSLPASASVWAVAGNNIYNTNTGLVGINTSLPTARLHIRNPNADTIPFLLSNASGRITRINGARELYHEGDIWLHSAYGKLRLGYSDKGWYWGTINGGQDLQLWSHSTTDIDASRINRLYIDGVTGNVGINTNNTPAVYGKLIVDRNADMNGALGGYFGVVTGLNSSTTDGSGVYGISYAPRTGAQSYAGVSGYKPSNSTERYGVIGSSLGTSSGSNYSAGVGGYGDYGVLGYSSSNTGAGMIAQHNAGKTALEVNNGFIKATGTNKTAFIVTTSAGNTSGNNTLISYLNPEATDIIIVTHNWQGNYMGAIGVYYTLGVWRLFREDGLTMPAGEKFNVIVIKQ
jgi:hypothetical protein